MRLVELTDPNERPKQFFQTPARSPVARPNARGTTEDLPSTVQLHFEQPDKDGLPVEDSQLTVVEISVQYDISHDEMEDGHVFSQGGVNVDDWQVTRPFEWNDKQMNKLVPEMVACCTELEGMGVDAFESGNTSKMWDALNKAVTQQIDTNVDVPSPRDMRRRAMADI